ncbi:esterase-like activity of phytase family protein [Alterisphingorhabdus coralli]|uniref:Esterase-like activity of phytase family protein n=1 Tax=Alterisphingorhabdus coralli TaxID=3071408 RepID=A0AA97I127_9SPHN|nr:esterase-like activity of phytase family protein [Parasphingorhabdus sp. SCSIO 66989]WOE74835.1 esterase-like activity of phytase family protein [Parasphingorhabdus sp. SCSIO 66989]
MRRIRRILACLSLVILLAPGTFLRSPEAEANDSQDITLVPVALDSANPQKRQIGALDYIAGWELRSQNSKFGGISSMLVDPNGRILALSDGGTLFSFSVAQGSEASEEGASAKDFIAPLPGFRDEDKSKDYRDSESFVRDAEIGRFWVGFEGSNRIVRYDAAMVRAERGYRPKAMRAWPDNGGPEAIALLSDQRFLAFSEEEQVSSGVTQALMFIGDPTDPDAEVISFGYKPPIGYNITDATVLPDGRLLILHRRFTVLEGVSARISVADPADIGPDVLLQGRVIAALDPPLTVDNMEAIAVTREASGDDEAGDDDLMVWIASDDNFNTVQRSLLMKFRLDMDRLDAEETVKPGLSAVE